MPYSIRYYPGEVELWSYTLRDRVYLRLAALLLIAGALASFVPLLNTPVVLTVAVG